MHKIQALTKLALLTFLAMVTSIASACEDDDFFRQLVADEYVIPFKSGDVATWIEAFDPNAIALHNHRAPDRGRSAIESFGKMVHGYFDLKEYSVEVTDIRKSDDWVYTVGQFTTLFVAKSDGSEPFGREQGKFVLLWERQSDGVWKIILDMGNSNQ